MASDLVRVVDDGPVRTLRLDDPGTRNAFTPEVRDVLLEQLHAAERDESVGAVVLAGAGRGFCGGGNTKAMGATTPRDKYRSMLRTAGLAEYLAAMPTPVVAAVHGFAVGAGLALALACDLVVVEEDAVLRTAFRGMGLTPDMGAHWYLLRAFGPWRTKQIVWQDQPIDAREAFDAGIVAEVVAPGEAYAAALRIARALADGPRDAIAMSKSVLARIQAADLGDVLAAEALGSALLRTTPDHAEAVAARREKREPRFGRPPQDPATSG